MGLITLDLKPVPPFRLDLTVWTLRRRLDNVIDRWDGTTYRRVLVLDDMPLELGLSKPRLQNRRACAFVSKA